MKSVPPIVRCGWAGDSPLMQAYHDQEWGRPLHDDRQLFEFLILEGAQAGLSWATILKRRDGYRRVFYDFDIERIAAMTARDTSRALQDPGIIRNRAKVAATQQNAKAYLALKKEGRTLNDFLWGFVKGKTIVQRPTSYTKLPPNTPESDAMSKAMKTKGFAFVGTTICYALMQAVGLVDDHERTCWRAKR